MIESTHAAAETEGAAADDGEIDIADFLSDERVVIDLEVSSRKRLFEQMAKLVSSQHNTPDLDTVLQTLTQREKLGCTGIGNGIALPHGRIEGFVRPVIAVARLKQAIDYDAPDGVPVWLTVCLLVPVDANDTHLRLLSALAERFKSAGFCKQIKRARSAAELAERFKKTQEPA